MRWTMDLLNDDKGCDKEIIKIISSWGYLLGGGSVRLCDGAGANQTGRVIWPVIDREEQRPFNQCVYRGANDRSPSLLRLLCPIQIYRWWFHRGVSSSLRRGLEGPRSPNLNRTDSCGLRSIIGRAFYNHPPGNAVDEIRLKRSKARCNYELRRG